MLNCHGIDFKTQHVKNLWIFSVSHIIR